MTDSEFIPHLAALARSVEAGFQFRQISEGIHGFRVREEALDIVVIHDVSAALAARYRMADLDKSGPAAALWSTHGTVADVVAELLALPPHGEPLAPRLALDRTTLWLP